MTRQQLGTKERIERFSPLFGLDPKWAVAVAMTESSLGEHLVSPTGCSGVFQMSQIAMKDLLQEMREPGRGDLIGVLCGLAYLKILLDRFGSIDQATLHFCSPADRDFYWGRVKEYMDALPS